MNHKQKILVSIFIIIVLSVVIFMHALSMNAKLWREPGQRDEYVFDVYVEGLSGRKVEGITTIMVPFPATKDGKLVDASSQKEPSLEQHILDQYILHTPDQCTKGPYFDNLTEQLDNKLIIGGWTTYITETEDGYMLKFESNEPILEDIGFGAEVVVDDIDIFDPINKDSPLLSPVFDVSEISTVSYGEQVKYSSTVSYGTYVYLSDNIKNGTKSIVVSVEGHNDPTEWEKEYRGKYNVLILENVEGAGKIKVNATLTQDFWFPLVGD